MSFYVYILASKRNGTLYVGHTDNLNRRMWQHLDGMPGSFTTKHLVHRLVHYEQFETRAGAFARERAMKKWRRIWKLELIERFNPAWNDLYETLEPN